MIKKKLVFMLQDLNFIIIRKSGKVLHMKRKVRQKNLFSTVKSDFETDLWKSFQKYWDVDEGNWNNMNDNVCLIDLPYFEKARLFFVQE